MAHGYPDTIPASVKTANAQGDKNKVLALYQQLVSPGVQMADLFKNGVYNPRNKWNTTNGAVHLTHPRTRWKQRSTSRRRPPASRSPGPTVDDQDA
jgi:hypothetical protein